jgi:hypothetical protein
MLTRRAMIASTASAVVAMQVRGFLQEPAITEVTEEYCGDPDLPAEAVTFNPATIASLSDVTTSGRAIFKRWEPKLPAGMLATARGLIGSSRVTTPDAISDMLALFGLPLKDKKERYVAYCAAGLSYAALDSYANSVTPGFDATKKLDTFRSLAPEIERYYFYPTVSCRDMMFAALAKRRWVPRADTPAALPKPGWVVLFDWSGRGNPNHCGIVQSATDQHVFTVEFNTSSTDAGSQRDGGAVAARKRSYDRILGFIRTDVSPPKI